MECLHCAFKNGEMEDTCGRCGKSLSLLSNDKTGRKLRAVGSHPDAPNRKSPWQDEPIPNSDAEGAEKEDEVRAMFRMMMKRSDQMMDMMTTVKDEVSTVRKQTFEAIDDLKKDIEQDFERVESNIDNLTDEHRETKAGGKPAR